jgi:predicted alpha-1,2-mannosidase
MKNAKKSPIRRNWFALLFLFALLLFTLLNACNKKQQVDTSLLQDLTQYVDPFIGSSFHGHVFVGANVPFGAVQLGPMQATRGWDWCSGYHYSDTVLIGFSHTHLSGTGIGDLGDILMMPTTGKVRTEKSSSENLNDGYSSIFSHRDEVVKPGYYKVNLKRYDVQVELTTSERVGFHRYSFPRSDSSNIIIDLVEGIGWDAPVKTHLRKLNDSTLVGYRFSKGWAEDQRIFFTAIFSKPLAHVNFFEGKSFIPGDSTTGIATKASLQFQTQQGEQVLVKVGISPVSTANAEMNIRTEIPHWNFEQVKQNANEAWNRELNKIQIEAKSTAQLRTFYTAMYHTMIAPSIFNDHNGDYRGTDRKIYHDTTFTNLTTFSLWDTYRAAHPLFTILQTERVNDMMNSMIKIYQQQGKLPVWHLMGNETNTMPGNSALPVLSDACLKNFDGFDHQLALDAMIASALKDERGLHAVKEFGFIPADSEVESVAKGLEYSIDDWCVAQVAKKAGREEDYQRFSKRGKNYQHYFDPGTHFMRGRISESKWRTPFSPFISRHMEDDFAEGNAWQYTWLVPQDVEGLVALMGGEKNFLEKLDSLFVAKGDMGEKASSDITGLIGQYAHGNEPGHHIPYLYGYTTQPWKTAEKVRYILDSLYKDTPDGLCGNEDVGQMSAWYVFSSIGFYPVNPANGAFVFGSPLFDKVTLRLAKNKKFTITVKNNSSKNIYIQEITLNGISSTKSWLQYKDIMRGGEMIITMGDKPGTMWGTHADDRAKSLYE